jgi:hypothetical protein
MAAAHLSLVEVVPGGIPLRDRRGSAPAPRYRSSAAMAVAMWVALRGSAAKAWPLHSFLYCRTGFSVGGGAAKAWPLHSVLYCRTGLDVGGPARAGRRRLGLCTPSCTAVLAWMWVALRGPAPGAARHTQRVPDPREGLCPFEPQKRGHLKCSPRCHASGVPNAGIDPNCSRTAVTAAIQLTRMQQAEARSLIRPINPATHCRREPTENHIVFRDRPPSRREASHRAGLVP